MAGLTSNCRGLRNIEILRRLNIATLVIAVTVYVGVLGIAVFYRVVPLAVFSSCIMLAEILVFQFVRTWCDFLELDRNRELSKMTD